MNDAFLLLHAPKERPTFTIDLPAVGESLGFELEIRDQDCNRILWLVVEPARPLQPYSIPKSTAQTLQTGGPDVAYRRRV